MQNMFNVSHRRRSSRYPAASCSAYIERRRFRASHSWKKTEVQCSIGTRGTLSGASSEWDRVLHRMSSSFVNYVPSAAALRLLTVQLDLLLYRIFIPRAHFLIFRFLTASLNVGQSGRDLWPVALHRDNILNQEREENIKFTLTFWNKYTFVCLLHREREREGERDPEGSDAISPIKDSYIRWCFGTESLSVLESSENNTSELQSSEENTSNQSSESESVEATSEDKTSEESDSHSDESDQMDSMAETEDNSMGSEENLRKSWVRVFPSVIKGASGEDNTSTEVTGHPGLSGKRPTRTKKVQIRTKQPLLEKSTDGSDTTSDSADTSDSSDVSAAASDSTASSSSESQESQETSDSNDSSTASKSTEDSNASDSAELDQVRAKNCVNSTQSCESEEYFLQDIGDDAHSLGEHLLVPDEDDRELRLRR
ncbi:hypothetical protein CCH79_00013962 [Gambusia affinis]|uniref:Uncharacterized protein n=1 Tax=Gambusia affinis TaxID=33528 RepID=A0A315W136_GAMAF|nr:hypothetical protein CCH79_00013962 [Gambusia affinis]